MIKLINRGKYDKSIQDEFEHLTTRLSTFLSQIFNEDGVYIPPEGGSNVSPVTSVVKRVKVGDLFISNGSTIGYSTLPWAVDLNKTLIINNGGVGANTNCTYALTWNGSSNIQLKGIRNGAITADAAIHYCVVEYW